MAKTFLGGIPLGMTAITSPVPTPLTPRKLCFRLPPDALLQVEKGTEVLCHTLLSRSPNVFSGACGTVQAVIKEEKHILLVIATDPSRTDRAPTLQKLEGRLGDKSEEELAEAMLACGITPPTLAENGGRALIVRCFADVEDDPTPAALCEYDPVAVVGGAKILMKYAGVTRGYLAVAADTLSTARALEGCLARKDKLLRVVLLRNKYPQTEEHLLVSTVCDVEVHPKTDVASRGFYVVSPTLCQAVYYGLVKGYPASETFVTRIEEQSELLTVPIGTPYSELLPSATRIVASRGGRFFEVSPGDAVDLTIEAVKPYPVASSPLVPLPCLYCGRCVEVCPTGLMPHLLYRAAVRGDASRLRALDVDNCLLCGCCEAICPSSIPLSEIFDTVMHRKEEAPL